MRTINLGAVAILLVCASLSYVRQQTIASARVAMTEDQGTGPCTATASPEGDRFTINCQPMTKEQGDKIAAIIDRILANKLDLQLVMTKLDDITKAPQMNPPARTYFCDGMWQSVGPKSDYLLNSKTGGNDSEFLNMIELFRNERYSQLLKACLANVRSAPDWLTPRLFCGLAYAHLNDKQKAQAMLMEFESKAGPSYDSPPCHDMTVILRSLVK